jgi:hypothetical protein
MKNKQMMNILLYANSSQGQKVDPIILMVIDYFFDLFIYLGMICQRKIDLDIKKLQQSFPKCEYELRFTI